MVEWQHDPIGWIERYLGVPRHTLVWSLNDGYQEHQWDGTVDPIAAACAAVADGQDTALESGTGTGKSYLAALLKLWFLACHAPSRVMSYAPKEDQLRLFMWAETTKLWPRFQRLFPTARLTDLRIRMDGRSDVWGAQGFPVLVRAEEESAVGAQGVHSPHMLLITEETPGIEPAVMTAIMNTKTAAHNFQLALGNPDSQHDTLHKFATRKTTTHIRISALDHPNVVTGRDIIPGAVGRRSIAERTEDYGLDSRLYQSRIRGIAPTESADALIRYIWIQHAVELWHNLEARRRLDGPKGLGIDVANSENGDKAAIAEGPGAILERVRSFPCPNNLHLATQVALLMELEDIEDQRVGVDSVGVGAGTVNKLIEHGRMVVALNGGDKTWPTVDEELWRDEKKSVLEREKYRNLRAQMWWQLRVDLQRGRVALPPDESLHQDLLVPTWETKNGVIIVEPKEVIRERLGRSPDKGDAAVYWNWVRYRRPLPVEEEPLSAFAPEQLEYDARESRRVRNLPPRRLERVDPLVLENTK